MSLGVQAVLLGIVGFLSNAEWFLGTCFIQHPIILGPLTGLIVGDLQAGIIMGGTLELAWAGFASIGAYDPPDPVAGTILGVAFAIKSGAGPEAALSLGVPIAVITLAIGNALGYPVLQIFAHICDKNAAEGNDRALTRNCIISGFLAWGISSPIVPLAYYFGSDKVVEIMGGIPEFISEGMDIAGGLLPALGFALLARMIMKRELAPFFFVGYFIVAYSGISTTIIQGVSSLQGGMVSSYNDHRMAMMEAIASTICEDVVVIDQKECVQKSYPSFWEHFESLGGDFDEF